MRYCPAIFALFAAITAVSCSSSDTAPESPVYSVDPATWLAEACTDTTDMVEQIPAGLAPFEASRRGEVIRCAPVASYSAAQLHQAAVTLGYGGPAFSSGVKAYWIAFRTERVAPAAGGNAPEGVSGALLLLPDHPRAGAAPSPLIVAAHGSVGVADACTPSRGDITKPGDHLDDFRSALLPLVGYGFPVIAPDYAGFGFGVSSGWILAEDEAHSVLDATRAAAKVLKSDVLNGKVAFVGHSQGGHAVLSAQSYAATYGMQGTLVGVATYAPMWFSARAFGAVVSPSAGLNTTEHDSLVAYALEYFYTHAEVLDGPGTGVSMLQPDKQEPARTLLTTKCLSEVSDQIKTLGATPADFFEATFVENVGLCGLAGISCDKEPATMWAPRFKADRPAVDPQGAPILVWQGKRDKTVTAGLAKCGFNKMQGELGADAATKLTICGDATATHGGFLGSSSELDAGITRRGADWVNQWLAARTLGTPEPAACAGEEALAPESGTLKCQTPPPNED